jgi:hypothetical protein
MSAEHYVVLGVGRPRATWFADVGRWSTTSAIPVEFVRCVSTDEVRARLGTGRAWSAVLVDEGSSGLDRDLLDAARGSGCAPIVVTPAPSTSALERWVGLGAAAVVAEPLERDALLAVLRDHATPVDRGAGDVLGALEAAAADDTALLGAHPTEGRLVTVVGGGGTGTSTVAMAVAQAEATDPTNGGRVVLLDASLDASLALLHHNPDVVPGLQELVELHRTGRPDADAVRSVLWPQPDRGYDLLPGLRRHRDWTALRPRALAASVGSLRRDHAVVVADADADLEGEPETGSIDVEERNACARLLTRTADVVVVTGVDGPAGVHRLVRTLADLLTHGVDAERLLPVVNRAPRAPHRRAEIARTVALLLGEVVPGAATATPLMVPARRDLDAVAHDGAPLPKPHWQPIGAAVAALLARVDRAAGSGRVDEPVPVRPGSLGVGGGA